MVQFLFFRFISVLFLFANQSCSSPGLTPPSLEEEDTRNNKIVVIAGLNDFHGALKPFQRKNEMGAYQIGGAAFLASHMRLIRKQFSNRLLILDAGNQWQGSLESQILHGQPVIDFYNLIGVDAAVLGRYELTLGPQTSGVFRGDPQGRLRANLLKAQYPYLSANLFEPDSNENWKQPNLYPSQIFVRNGIRIGILGLTSSKTQGFQFYDAHAGVRFGDPVYSALQTIHNLKKRGAQAIILIANLGIECANTPKTKFLKSDQTQYPVWSEKTPQGDCSDQSELSKLLQKIPDGKIDAIIAGNQHHLVHHWINGIPVLQSGAMGMYYQLLYLSFDPKTFKIKKELTRIEGPIPVCRQIYQNQNDCAGSRPIPRGGRGKLVIPSLHGNQIYAHPGALSIIQQAKKDTRLIRTLEIAKSENGITHSQTKGSKLGNLLADALREHIGADFALINPGALTGEIKPGPITYETIFQLLPHETQVVKIKITGRQLRQIIQIANSGARGIYSVSGLKIELVDLPFQAKSKDLNNDHRIAHWEVNRLLSLRDDQGNQIINKKFYTLATTDYLIFGGDDLSWIMKQIANSEIDRKSGGLVRDAFMDYLAGIDTPLDQYFHHPNSQKRIVLYKSKKEQIQAHRKRIQKYKKRNR